MWTAQVHICTPRKQISAVEAGYKWLEMDDDKSKCLYGVITLRLELYPFLKKPLLLMTSYKI
jgi:hypothetical protein